MKDEELKIEEIETSHTPGGVGTCYCCHTLFFKKKWNIYDESEWIVCINVKFNGF
jgi:hypothetical protein